MDNSFENLKEKIFQSSTALNRFNKTDHKIHFISGANSYTFQHQGVF